MFWQSKPVTGNLIWLTQNVFFFIIIVNFPTGNWGKFSVRNMNHASSVLPVFNKTMTSGTFLPPANEVCEGYVFTGVCLSTGGGGSTSGRYGSYWNAFFLKRIREISESGNLQSFAFFSCTGRIWQTTNFGLSGNRCLPGLLLRNVTDFPPERCGNLAPWTTSPSSKSTAHFGGNKNWFEG